MTLAEKTYQALMVQMERTLLEALLIAPSDEDMQAAYNRYKTGVARAHEIKTFLLAQKDSPG